LTQIGKSVGLVDEKRWQKFQNKVEAIEKLKSYLQNTRQDGLSLWEHLRKPNNNVAAQLAQNPDIKGDVLEAVTIDAKYEGYLAKQHRLAMNLQILENKKIPPDLDFSSITHLRAEAKEKLSAFRPSTLAQAGRISGITPSDITVLQVHLKKYSRTERKS
jgi:tRNA uridine 5-carboxymethylaminomethyl modification enzyme